MAWSCSLSGKLESVEAAAKTAFDQIINHSAPPMDAQEKALCSAAYTLVSSVLAAQPPGSFVECRASGDVVAGAKGVPSSYPVWFQVSPISGFLP